MESSLPRKNVFFVVGTRPEAIKVAPAVEAARRHTGLTAVLVSTSQHREMLRQALRPFDLVPDIDLDVMTADQTPARVAAEVLRRFEPHLLEGRPDWVVVQGDTTTALAAAWGAFYAGVRVAHIEAGLRSGRLDSPFPEEFNRKGVSVAASLHFAPTQGARRHLLAEGVVDSRIHVVGNTIVDAVKRIRATATAVPETDPRQLILVTLHRRESFGLPVKRVLEAIRQLAIEREGQVRIVYPVHPNPSVDRPAREILGGVPGIDLHAPLDYPDFLALFARARLVLSDSGGVQEEAPSLGVPVLVLREVTERPEVIESGWGMLVGTDADLILKKSRELLDSESARKAMTSGPNPFGDGKSGERIAEILAIEP
jgi:UDP-N-acetylglucosamine 2-epimerase (non-hydrolysing)